MDVIKKKGIPMTNEYRYIGKSVPRQDSLAVVTGRSEFVGDLKFPDLLHGKVLRSPHAHAKIKEIDTRLAERLPGVEAVITWKTIDDWVFGNPPIFRVLDSKVRYVGDAVALVAAKTEDIAQEALKKIQVTYEVLPAVLDDFEALEPGAPNSMIRYRAIPCRWETRFWVPNPWKGLTWGMWKKVLPRPMWWSMGTVSMTTFPIRSPWNRPVPSLFGKNLKK
jgi:xanthine dehydrogenase molybdenum-binding subunit